MTKIVVIGGTGLIGSKVVARLVEHGHEAIAASPKSGVNTLTGEGLAEVLSGAQVVVDGSNSPSFEDKAALDFFTTSTGNLLAAEKTANAMLDVAPPPTPERATGTKGLRTMGTVSPGFKGRGRRREPSAELPPGQYLVEDFPVLSAGPTPSIDLQDWEFIITNETGDQQRWDWNGFRGLPSEPITVDLHCVTHWSKLATSWEGVSLDTLLAEVETSANFALAESYGGYSTNLPLEDLTDGKAWIAFRYDGQELEAEHGGPARLLVPHLYFWKSAKWVRGIRLLDQDEPGFWESLGYHNYGDPWLEQRYWGD